MGRKLDIFQFRLQTQFSVYPGKAFPASYEDYPVHYGRGNEIIGFNFEDIAYVNESIKDAEIPDIDDKYDLIGTDLQDKTIREIVLEIKRRLLLLKKSKEETLLKNKGKSIEYTFRYREDLEQVLKREVEGHDD